MPETTAPTRFVTADPYPCPYDGALRPDNTTLLVIDMQTDFCGIGGYVDRMGYDISLTRAAIGPIKGVLAAMRAGGFHVIHTREGHRPDLSDLPENKAGVTTEVCVQTTMREANDRGYDCLLVEDATESYFPEFKQSALEMIRAQGGIVGWTAPPAALRAAR